MLIRQARRADIPALRLLGEATWQVAYEFAGPDYIAHGPDQWWTEQALLDCLRDTTVFVADQDGQVLGVGNLDVRGTVPVIWKRYVHPSTQGTGLGSALLAQLIAAAPLDATSVRLEYVAGNEPAAAFYRAKGFLEIGTEPGERAGWPGTVWVERDLARDEPRGRARSASPA